MRKNPTQRTIHWTVAAAFVVVAAGCGDDGDGEKSAASAPLAAESAYCDEAIEWSIHELEPFDETDPVAFRTYWEDFQGFEEAAVDTAPDEIKDDWELKVETENATISPVLEKYGFDLAAVEESGTPEEQAAFEAPPEVQAAQDRILIYESEVCGAQQPQPADVSYAGEEPGPYCELVATQDERAAEALAGGGPAEVEAVFDELEETSAALIEAAPEAIKDDVADLAAWTQGRQRDAAERHGYDFRAAMREGTPQDRADLNHADEEIRDQFARVAAYEEQVCGG